MSLKWYDKESWKISLEESPIEKLEEVMLDFLTMLKTTHINDKKMENNVILLGSCMFMRGYKGEEMSKLVSTVEEKLKSI